MDVALGGSELIRSLLVLLALVGTGPREDLSGFRRAKVLEALPASYCGYATVEVHDLAVRIRKHLDLARDLDLPVDSLFEQHLARLRDQYDISPETMRAIASRLVAVHVAVAGLDRHENPRFVVILEGPMEDHAYQAINGLRQRTPSQTFVFGSHRVFFIGSGRDRQSVAAALLPGMGIISPDLNLVRDAVRSLSAARKGMTRPGSIARSLEAHGLSLVGSAPAARPTLAAYVNAPALVQLLYLEEGRRYPMNDAAIGDLFSDLGALGPGVVTWNAQGLTARVAVDSESDTLQLLEAPKEGCTLTRGCGGETVYAAAAALKDPGKAILTYLERIRAVDGTMLRQGRQNVVDRFERELRQEIGVEAADLANSLRELAVMTAEPTPRRAFFEGAVLMRFKDAATTTRLFDALVAARRQKGGEVEVTEAGDARLCRPLVHGGPTVAVLGDLAALGMRPERCVAALNQAQTGEPDAMLTKLAVGKSLVATANLAPVLSTVVARPGGPEAASQVQGLKDELRFSLSLRADQTSVAATLDKSPDDIASLLKVLAPVVQQSFMRARLAAGRMKSRNHLKQLVTGCMLYKNDHQRKWPPTLDQLGPYIANKQIFKCPVTNQPYTYVPPPEEPKQSAQHIVLFCRPLPDGRHLAAFADGHVQTMTAQSFEQTLERTIATNDAAKAGK